MWGRASLPRLLLLEGMDRKRNLPEEPPQHPHLHAPLEFSLEFCQENAQTLWWIQESRRRILDLRPRPAWRASAAVAADGVPRSFLVDSSTTIAPDSFQRATWFICTGPRPSGASRRCCSFLVAHPPTHPVFELLRASTMDRLWREPGQRKKGAQGPWTRSLPTARRFRAGSPTPSPRQARCLPGLAMEILSTARSP